MTEVSIVQKREGTILNDGINKYLLSFYEILVASVWEPNCHTMYKLKWFHLYLNLESTRHVKNIKAKISWLEKSVKSSYEMCLFEWSVGIVHSQTKGHGVCFVCLFVCLKLLSIRIHI
jgi:hypothetical protein